MDYPLYKLTIDPNLKEDSEVDFVALVDEPAIMKDFLAFSEKQCFEVISEDRRIISGPMMLAGMPIYRENEKFGKHYIHFDKETIETIAIKFAKKGFQNNVNLMHEPTLKVEGVTMFESWLVDSKRGIAPMKGFEDAPDGSWFGSFHVQNDAVWQAVKEGKVKGFSVEGLFIYEEPKQSPEEILQRVQQLLLMIP
jgi:hypothetical protein